jgi:restriction system protein
MERPDDILASALRREPFSFDRLMVTAAPPPFEPGPLGVAAMPPIWDDYAPARPGGIGRLVRRYGAAVAAARERFAEAEAEHQRQEAERQRALAMAKAKYDRAVTEHRAKLVKRNALVAQRRKEFEAGDPAGVEWYVGRLLAASPYPEEFPRGHQVTYAARRVTVDFELPSEEAELAARIALRTVHEIFGATPAALVDTVVFHGRIDAAHPATGRPDRAHLLSVAAGRDAFAELNLATVDPVACVSHLSGSPDPGTPSQRPPARPAAAAARSGERAPR